MILMLHIFCTFLVDVAQTQKKCSVLSLPILSTESNTVNIVIAFSHLVPLYKAHHFVFGHSYCGWTETSCMVSRYLPTGSPYIIDKSYESYPKGPCLEV